jgi:F-type H+-transporting ATPase subunit b
MTIDWWTLGIQGVNVAILVWLLQRVFWRPVADMIEQRGDTARRTLAEAKATRDKAAVALAEIERTRAGFATEHEKILAAAKATAELASAARLAEAGRAVATLEAAAKATIEREKQAAEVAWSARSSQLAIEIAKRLAARLDGAAVRQSFLDWLLKEIAALPEPTRQAVTALEAVSATLLDAAERERTNRLISAAFGGNPQIVFKTDPTLIAGLELHGPHLTVSNSWRADLAKIHATLTHDERR